MRIRIMQVTILVLGVAAVRALAATAIVEKQPEFPRQPAGVYEKIAVDTDYDYGWVNLAGREGAWKLTTVAVSYPRLEKISPYLMMEAWDRFREKDYTINAGSYLKFSNRSYLHAEVGFGADRDYIYQSLARIEFENVLIGQWNWFAGMRYLNYPQNDVYILYPGLIYYWGDNYLQIFFNDGFTESRGSAQSGQVRAQMFVSKKLAVYGGAAVGERLFDIFLLPASEQNGYILFCGLKCQMLKQMTGRLGFSYSYEHPSFIKRSIEAGISLKF